MRFERVSRYICEHPDGDIDLAGLAGVVTLLAYL
jgi:hypothetical protein